VTLTEAKVIQVSEVEGIAFQASKSAFHLLISFLSQQTLKT
jgi:hypothetical protein